MSDDVENEKQTAMPEQREKVKEKNRRWKAANPEKVAETQHRMYLARKKRIEKAFAFYAEHHKKELGR